MTRLLLSSPGRRASSGARSQGSRRRGRPCPGADDFTCVELDKHCSIGFQIFHGHRQAEIVQDQKLDFEVIQFGKGQTTDLNGNFRQHARAHWGISYRLVTYLGVSRVCVKDVREELAGASDSSNDQPMNIETVHHKERGLARHRSRTGPIGGPTATVAIGRLILLVIRVRVIINEIAVIHVVAVAAVICFSAGGILHRNICLCRLRRKRCFFSFLVLHHNIVDPLCHSIKVHQQAQKDFKGCRAILVYPAQIAQDSDRWDILAMESQDAAAERTHVMFLCRAIVLCLGLSDMTSISFDSVAVEGILLEIIGSCNLGEKRCNHLDDVTNWHAADFVLHGLERWSFGATRRHVSSCESFYVSKIANMNSGLLDIF